MLVQNFRMFLFAIIRNTETELVSKFNITKYPQVIVKPSASDKGVYYNGGCPHPTGHHSYHCNTSAIMPSRRTFLYPCPHGGNRW